MAVVDGLRAVAVAMIFLLHAWGASGHPEIDVVLPLVGHVPLHVWISKGDLGVPLFFILSGFLLSQPFLRASFQGTPRPSLRSYFKRRLLRIVPAYYACILMLMLFFTPYSIDPDYVYSWDGMFELVTHLTFTHFLFIESSGSWGIAGPMWTLTHEAIFYLVLPFVAFFFAGRRAVLALLVALAVSLGFLHLAHNSLDFWLQWADARAGPDEFFSEENIRIGYMAPQFPAHVFNFAVGMTLAALFVAVQIGKVRRPGGLAAAAMFAAGLALFIGSVQYFYVANPDLGEFFPHNGTPTDTLGLGLMLGGLVFGVPLVKEAFSTSLIRVLGIVSYSAFLWHLPIMFLLVNVPTLQDMTPGERFPALALWALPLVLAISVGSYLLVEKPFLVTARSRRAVPEPASLPVAQPVLSQQPPTPAVPRTEPALAPSAALVVQDEASAAT